ncbi:MAG: Uma2 family endonuclease [Phycisphaerales bacterium]|nr:Uma2 family endonuclease [Phycisphaerales bacterium]
MHDLSKPEPIRLKYADLAGIPPDGKRYETLEGSLFMSPSPTSGHQVIVGNLHWELRTFVQSRHLGKVLLSLLDVELEDFTVVEPDLIFITERNAAIIQESHVRGVPDLLVEVVSPTSRNRDLREKRNIYARVGVPHDWIVDIEERVIWELALTDGAYALASEARGDAIFRPAMFTGLELTLASLWKV